MTITVLTEKVGAFSRHKPPWVEGTPTRPELQRAKLNLTK